MRPFCYPSCGDPDAIGTKVQSSARRLVCCDHRARAAGRDTVAYTEALMITPLEMCIFVALRLRRQVATLSIALLATTLSPPVVRASDHLDSPATVSNPQADIA